MVGTLEQRRLRLVKERHIRELKERTAARVIREFKAKSTGIGTDVEERGTQCTDFLS